MNWFPNYNYILASQSPRRKELLESLGLPFSVKIKEVDENYPDTILREEVPVYLAEIKAKAFQKELAENDLLITADTVVCLHGNILGKPAGYDEAFRMLTDLGNQTHDVITGVCLTSVVKSLSFSATTQVTFKSLTPEEINFYIKNYKPYDKAGSYGIQEWIGAIGITSIQGSFYNVMGLPVQKLYEMICTF